MSIFVCFFHSFFSSFFDRSKFYISVLYGVKRMKRTNEEKQQLTLVHQIGHISCHGSLK